MIEYRDNQPLDPAEVARLFETSRIGRPTKDVPRIAKMFANANVVISAWDGARLIGVSRELIGRTRSIIGEEVSLILLPAPDAMDYYPKVGFALADNAYVFRRKR